MAKKKTETVPDDLLSPIEHLVMKAVLALGEKAAYGMEIFSLIQSAYPSIHVGSVYTTLDRLSFKGYLEGRLGEVEPVRGGKARKYYRVTGIGKKVLDFTQNVLLSPLPQRT